MRAQRLSKIKKNRIVTYELKIYNKLNQNNILISFNLFFLNPILTNIGAFSKTPQESPDNKDF